MYAVNVNYIHLRTDYCFSIFETEKYKIFIHRILANVQ